MTKRYYVTSVEFNKVAQAENRSVPSAFDSLDKAKAKFYTTLANNINNNTISDAVVIMFDSNGNKVMSEHWHEEETEVTGA